MLNTRLTGLEQQVVQVRGFTLIEMLVALAIFAMISAIAIPLYTQYSQRAYRAEVMSDLMSCAQALERYSAASFTFVGANSGGDNTALNAAICDPLSVRQGRYLVTAVTTQASYELTAVPIGSMAGTGTLTLDDAGQRTWDENNDSIIDPNEDDWVKD